MNLNDFRIDLGSAGGGYPVPVTPWGYAIHGDGVTPNDVSDIDRGPIGLLNFPVPLQARRFGRFFDVEGVLWGAFSGEYVVEAFANATCAEARHYGSPYGAGEHYLGSVTVTPGITNLGEPAFSLIEGGLEEHYRYITLTASREDLGVTSEFSRCIPFTDASQTARTEVDPGENGLVKSGPFRIDFSVDRAEPESCHQSYKYELPSRIRPLDSWRHFSSGILCCATEMNRYALKCSCSIPGAGLRRGPVEPHPGAGGGRPSADRDGSARPYRMK